MAVSSYSIKTSQTYRKQTHRKQMRPLDFTVVICTYNGEHRLPDVLDRLRNQTGVEALRWEILIVDNNSHDQTAAVIQRYQQNWPQDYPIRALFEGQQGAGYARKLAVIEAQSTLIGFLDDDNLPAHNWVSQAYQFGQAHPEAGAYGSEIAPCYEVSPPPEFDRISPFLAIVQRGDEPQPYQSKRRVLPPGAGLVVRRQAWLESVPERCVLNGRFDNQMLTGEDLEALVYIQRSGWEIWHQPSMKLRHKISKRRLTREYLIPFFRGIGLSRHITRMMGLPVWQRFVMLPLYIANDLRKIALHWWKYRGRASSELVPACEMQLYLSSLHSPFFFMRQWLSGQG
jgi:glycosyltransferase involved in cell wall biosynthesis